MDSEDVAENRNHDFVRLLAVHERAIRGFVRASLPCPPDVDDVMQEVLVVAWKKFADLNHPDDFAKWVCVIAKYEVLKFRRKKARERLVLSEDVIAMLADEGIDENPKRAKQLQALDSCIVELPDARRKLIAQVYQPGVTISSVASQLGKKENAVHQLLWRIRQTLLNCIRNKMSYVPN